MNSNSLQRVTPDYISTLKASEIFVFGSNAQGMHAGGAARYAMDYFGAIWGQGEGLQGQSYAIPTMEGLDNIGPAVERFISFAQQHPDYKFLVTPIGCGIAGYREEEIAPFFRQAVSIENIYLPKSFWKILQRIPEAVLAVARKHRIPADDITYLRETERGSLYIDRVAPINDDGLPAPIGCPIYFYYKDGRVEIESLQ